MPELTFLHHFLIAKLLSRLMFSMNVAWFIVEEAEPSS